ncbi:MAG: DEAD/DEAH box helicase [Pauljensenia sp.]
MSAPLNELLDDLEDRGLLTDDDALYEEFSSWASSTGRPLYRHQDESLIEILSGNHVIAATPTGSGKSMIALAAHFVSMAHGGRSYYTAPLKALVSEKFFDLVSLFGADNVGMVTGDVSLNADAPIICCTAEILANQSLREGPTLDADMIVMDEFHFYADPQRGWAWQVPLLELTRPQFIAMSATLGDTSVFRKQWTERTGRPTVEITDAQRPVPLEYDYVVDTLQDTVERLLSEGRHPIYIVHFSQKDAVDTASSLMDRKLVSPEVRSQIARELSSVSFTKGFGQTLRGLLSHGIGVHHAGMLPRYRRLVERLTQQGLLPVICGTDTLGVGINVPIRTVLLTSLVKFDGSKMRHLRSREFHQIAGRAGRAGFDTVGFVRVLAPEHEVEAARERARLTAAQEAARDEREAKRAKKKASKKRSGPKEGQITWSRSTFERLRDAAPEALQSHFEMTHSTVLNVLGGAADAGRDPAEHLVHLALHNDDQPLPANPHIRHLADIYTSLLQAGVVEHLSSARAQELGVSRLQLVADLPDDFALNQPLSPFALAAFELLDPDSPTFALDVISIVEAVLEDPRPLLYAQENQAKAAAVASMKAQGMEYDERMAALEEISWPKPLEELLSPAFSVYARSNPWVGDLELSPKSVIREMIENAMTFTELISRYDVGRSEGVILRYLSDAYRMMRQVIPEEIMTEELESMISWLADLIRSVDSSLLDEWEAMMNGEELVEAEGGPSAVGAERAFGADESGVVAFTANRHAFRNAVRRTLFSFVELMSRDDVDGLERASAQAADNDGLFAEAAPWTGDDWDHALERYWAEHDWIDINQGARSQALCTLEEQISGEDILALMPFSARDNVNQRSRFEALARAVDEAPAGSVWLATQTITDPEGNMDWRIAALVDLAASDKEKRAVLTVLTVDAR